MDFIGAATLGLSYLTAWYGLTQRGEMQPGETVLVTGASGAVGTAAVQIARALGAGKVFGAISNPAKGQAVTEAGADALIDVADSPRDGIRAQLKAAGAPGVDVCLEMVGGAVFDGCLRALNPRGRVVVCGFVSGDVPEVKVNYLMVKNTSVMGMTVAEPFFAKSPVIEAGQQELLDLWSAGKLNPAPANVYPFDDFLTPILALGERTAVGKSVLTME